MKIGIIGLGKMGGGVAERLRAAGHSVVGYDQNAELLHKMTGDGFEAATSLETLVTALSTPRVIWVALPAGETTESTLSYLEHLLQPGDTVCDAGNSHFEQSKQRALAYQARGFHFLDVGISGGLKGRTEGYCLMVGGGPEAVQPLEALFTAIAQPEGYAHVGPSGAGHYIKMIHNGVEYALMQAYTEGAHLMAEGSFKGQIDVAQASELWQHGSIVSSYLNGLVAQVLRETPDLQGFATEVGDNGEGAWTVQEALNRHIAVPSIGLAVGLRHQSQDTASWSQRLLSALRGAFGGHPAKTP
jgi:6-phosphogluconate dehydrogenase